MVYSLPYFNGLENGSSQILLIFSQFVHKFLTNFQYSVWESKRENAGKKKRAILKVILDSSRVGAGRRIPIYNEGGA